MKNVIALSLVSLAIVGCVSSSYKLSVPPVEDKGGAKYHIRSIDWRADDRKPSLRGLTSSDQRQIDKLQRLGYSKEGIEKLGLGIRFADEEDDLLTVNTQTLASSSRAEGVYDNLYSDSSDIRVMILDVSCIENIGTKKVNGLSGILFLCTVGIWPMHLSITSKYHVTVSGPNSYKYQNGDFEIVKDEWTGWFAPLFVSGTHANHTQSAKNEYCPSDLVSVGLARKTFELAGKLGYDAYAAKQKMVYIEELSSSKDEAMLAYVVQKEKDEDVRAAAERRLKYVTEKTALEKKRREEVRADVAKYEENQKWESIIALCDKEIPNVDFLDAGELKDMKAAAERSKELDRIAEVKKAIDEKSKAEKWDDVIAICKEELSTASSYAGYRKEDDEFWKSKRAEACSERFNKVRSELYKLCDNGEWNAAVVRCEGELDSQKRISSTDGWSEEENKFFRLVIGNAERQMELARICSVTNLLQNLMDNKMWYEAWDICEKERQELQYAIFAKQRRRGSLPEDSKIWETIQIEAREKGLSAMGLRLNGNGELLSLACLRPSELRINDVYVIYSIEKFALLSLCLMII